MVVGGGCCLLRLSTKIASIREHLDNEEQKVLPLISLFIIQGKSVVVNQDIHKCLFFIIGHVSRLHCIESLSFSQNLHLFMPTVFVTC